MKKLLIFGILLILLSSIAFAEMCSETDDGKDYTEQGDTKYGITTFTDTCIISQTADMSVAKSSYLKEYYCSDDKRVSKIVNCLEEGYEICDGGKCFAEETTTTDSGETIKPKRVIPISCGDKKVNQESEECDPPGKICYTGNDIGQCDTNCKCEIMVSNATKGKDESEETTTTDTETTTEKTPAPRLSEDEREDLPVIKESGFFGKIWNWFTNIFS